MKRCPILWPPDSKSWLIWKDPDAAKDWGQEEKGMTEDEMLRWHLQFSFCESEIQIWLSRGPPIQIYLPGCSVQYNSAQPCLTLCDPMDCSTLGFPIHRQLPEIFQTQVHWVGDAIILCHPLLPPSIFPSIRVFSNESVLCQYRWPKYWSFSFSISPSNEHSGLISFRMDWLDLLAVQGTLKSLLQHHSSKASILWR